MRRLIVVAVLSLMSGAAPAAAQTFEGVVGLADRKSPAVGARVWLMQNNRVVDTARTDASGAFRLVAPKAGEYSLLIRRLGYAPEHTDDLFLADGQVRRDTIFTLSERVMQPVVVEVSRDARRYFQMDVRQIGSRYIGPDRLDQIRTGANNAVDLIRRAAPAGVIVRSDLRSGTCIETRIQRGCAPVFLDGMPLGTDVPYLSADEITAIVVLRSLDGSFVGRSGAVMLYTGR